MSLKLKFEHCSLLMSSINNLDKSNKNREKSCLSSLTLKRDFFIEYLDLYNQPSPSNFIIIKGHSQTYIPMTHFESFSEKMLQEDNFIKNIIASRKIFEVRCEFDFLIEIHSTQFELHLRFFESSDDFVRNRWVRKS